MFIRADFIMGFIKHTVITIILVVNIQLINVFLH
jgi:hypothetical protein